MISEARVDRKSTYGELAGSLPLWGFWQACLSIRG